MFSKLGLWIWGDVTELGDLDDAVNREIANLTTGRYYHACGMYTVGEYEAKVGFFQRIEDFRGAVKNYLGDFFR